MNSKMTYIYRLSGRGLCSELNSILGFYESIKNENCSTFLDASSSQYFRDYSIFKVFSFPCLFTAKSHPDSRIINAKEWVHSANAKYKTSLNQEECIELFSYTPEFQRKILSCMSRLLLPENYSCIHVRRGDKVNEKPAWTSKRSRGESLRYEFTDYISALQKLLPNLENIFIMTDDYKCVQEAKSCLLANGSPVKIFSLVKPSQVGHSTISDRQINKAYSEDELVQFFAEIEIAKASQAFVGTRSSNIYRYIYNQCHLNVRFSSLD